MHSLSIIVYLPQYMVAGRETINHCCYFGKYFHWYIMLVIFSPALIPPSSVPSRYVTPCMSQHTLFSFGDPFLRFGGRCTIDGAPSIRRPLMVWLVCVVALTEMFGNLSSGGPAHS